MREHYPNENVRLMLSQWNKAQNRMHRRHFNDLALIHDRLI